jgi:hypothetical protein
MEAVAIGDIVVIHCPHRDERDAVVVTRVTPRYFHVDGYGDRFKKADGRASFMGSSPWSSHAAWPLPGEIQEIESEQRSEAMAQIFRLDWQDDEGKHREWFSTFQKAHRRMRKVDPDGGIVTPVDAPSGKRAIVEFLTDNASY